VQAVRGQSAERLHIEYSEGSSSVWRSHGCSGWCVFACERRSWPSQSRSLGAFSTAASAAHETSHAAKRVTSFIYRFVCLFLHLFI